MLFCRVSKANFYVFYLFSFWPILFCRVHFTNRLFKTVRWYHQVFLSNSKTNRRLSGTIGGSRLTRSNPLFSVMCACSELRKQWEFSLVSLLPPSVQKSPISVWYVPFFCILPLWWYILISSSLVLINTAFFNSSSFFFLLKQHQVVIDIAITNTKATPTATDAVSSRLSLEGGLGVIGSPVNNAWVACAVVGSKVVSGLRRWNVSTLLGITSESAICGTVFGIGKNNMFLNSS